MGKIISIVNHKGGVGKTMTTQNLGAALALCGKKVLMVDIDPQCNLTTQCNASEHQPTIANIMYDDKIPIVPMVLSENYHIIPAEESLDEANIDLGNMEYKESIVVLRDVLYKKKDEYDYILIDCAPGSSLLMVNAIVASDEMIVPIADKNSILGAKKLTKILSANQVQPIGHYLLTKYDGRLSIARDIKAKLSTESGKALYHTIIRQTEALNQAACASISIFDYDKKSNGAEDYLALAKEIIGEKDRDMPF
ncbi:MAG: ParA family protein [Lachnospiraceae bacterium]|nr:ParA family protein [Lachnospiraceae bacterium]